MNTPIGALPAAAAASSTTINTKNAPMSPIPRSPAHRRDTSSESGKKRIPSEQWEAKRAIITQLYQEEKKSLKEVMEYLDKEHGFTATVKMFKSRIWKWGLDKKLKSDEVLAIMVLKRERDVANKPSEFTIRGQPVDMDNISRYIKRNPQLVARFHAGDVPSMQTTLEVQCRTPSPEPFPPVVRTTHGTPASIASPARQVEVLELLKAYIEESFYCGRWRWEYDLSCTTRIMDDRSDELFERTFTSLALVNRCMARGEATPLGLMAEPSAIEEMLEPAFTALKELVAVQSPIFATRMISLLGFLDIHHRSGLRQLIVTQLADIVLTTLGPQHRMSSIWNILASDPTYAYRELCDSAYVMMVSLLEPRIGPANLIMTMLYGDHVDYLLHSGRFDEAMTACSEYLAKAEGSGRQHAWIAELATLKQMIRSAQEDHNGEAAGINLELPNPGTDALFLLEDERRATFLTQQGNFEMQTGQVSAAAQHYTQAVQLLHPGTNHSGGDPRLLLATLANLEAAQTRLGDSQAATGTRAMRINLQAAFALETSSLAAHQRRVRGSVSSSSGPSIGSDAGRASSCVGEGGDETIPTTTGAATVGGWTTTVPSPGISGSDAGWGWSPDVFVSPRLGMEDWTYPNTCM